MNFNVVWPSELCVKLGPNIKGIGLFSLLLLAMAAMAMADGPPLFNFFIFNILKYILKINFMSKSLFLMFV